MRQHRQSRRPGVGPVRPRIEALEGRDLLAVSIQPISSVSVPATKTLFVPVQGTDSAGNPIDYTVTSSNPQVKATVRSGHPYLDISVAGFGDMVFQLFDDLDPNTVKEITGLVDKGFYNGLTFHRVVPNFVIQGGDPSGNGTGGPGFTFNQEYNADTIFDGTGQLAMANSGPNTNGSQLFVTIGPQRGLDFNYNLFGQLVSGQSVLQAIDSVSTDSNSKPLTPVTITSAKIIQDTHDTVLMIQAPAGAGASTITVTGTDAVTHATTTQSFQASYQADTVNDPPFLAPVANQSTTPGTPVSFQLTSTDLEHDPVVYSASDLDSPQEASVQVNGSTVIVTPNAGFTGTLQIQVAVQQQGATSRGNVTDPRDFRTITVNVTPQTLTPKGVAVAATAGKAQTSTYATFTAAPTGSAADFAATIHFGDGTTAAGSVVANNQGGYNVEATHTYAKSGSFTTSVTITGPSNASTTATATATVIASSTGGGGGGGTTGGGGVSGSETAPHVIDLIRRGRLWDPTEIDVVFSGPVDAATAENVSNYIVFGAGRDHRLGTSDDVRDRVLSATYNASTDTVTLDLRRRLNWFDPSKIIVLSGNAHGLTDPSGQALDGNDDGTPGGAFVATFARGVYVPRPDYVAPANPVAIIMGSPSTTLEGRSIAALFSRPGSPAFRQAVDSLPPSANQRVTSAAVEIAQAPDATDTQQDKKRRGSNG